MMKSYTTLVVAGLAAGLLWSCGDGDSGRMPEVRHAPSAQRQQMPAGAVMPSTAAPRDMAPSRSKSMRLPRELEREGYAYIEETGFLRVADQPLSTFSIDVDTASYSNVRRFLNDRRLPPPDAVRIEELINYFDYDYPAPTGEHPFSTTLAEGACPWNAQHRLVHIGVQGKRIDSRQMPATNLVFLLDVSGSMNAADKLPLLKTSLSMLARELRPNDRVAIVVYAGSAGLVLPPTPGNRAGEILSALDRLEAGGSTAGGAGIELAYKVAKEHFIAGGNNRVILATDGDFNVGPSSDGELVRLIEQKRKDGIFLTVLGFGTGNLQDAKMEQLADKGNGNYAYIDSVLEAKKVLVRQMGGTLLTIAKDVKAQVEFNPALVQAYRLIGYENRRLNAEEFNDDRKDAGELGAGHTVTALYEIVPMGVALDAPNVDPLKYQIAASPTDVDFSGELLTLKFRYKQPSAARSKLITTMLRTGTGGSDTSAFAFSAAVAQFGLLLRDSAYKGSANWRSVLSLAQAGKGQDPHGYRAEFIELAKAAQSLAHQR